MMRLLVIAAAVAAIAGCGSTPKKKQPRPRPSQKPDEQVLGPEHVDDNSLQRWEITGPNGVLISGFRFSHWDSDPPERGHVVNDDGTFAGWRFEGDYFVMETPRGTVYQFRRKEIGGFKFEGTSPTGERVVLATLPMGEREKWTPPKDERTYHKVEELVSILDSAMHLGGFAKIAGRARADYHDRNRMLRWTIDLETNETYILAVVLDESKYALKRAGVRLRSPTGQVVADAGSLGQSSLRTHQFVVKQGGKHTVEVFVDADYIPRLVWTMYQKHGPAPVPLED